MPPAPERRESPGRGRGAAGAAAERGPGSVHPGAGAMCGAGLCPRLSPAGAPRHPRGATRPGHRPPAAAGAAGPRSSLGRRQPGIRHLIPADCWPFVNDYVQEQLLSHRAGNEKCVWGSGCQLVRDFFFFSQEAISSTATHFVAVPDSLSSSWIWSTVDQWAGAVCTGCTVWLQTFSRPCVNPGHC